MTDEHLLTLLKMKNELANKLLNMTVKMEHLQSQLSAVIAVLEQYNV